MGAVLTQCYQRVQAAQEPDKGPASSGSHISACTQGCMLALSAESALMWTQGNEAAQDVGGLIDIILSNAMSLANSMPDITDPLAALGSLPPLSMPCFSPRRPHLQELRETCYLESLDCREAETLRSSRFSAARLPVKTCKQEVSCLLVQAKAWASI